MMARILLALLLVAASLLHCRAGLPGAIFADSTLRVDFILSGDAASAPSIAFGQLSKYTGWGGRQARLDSLLREGAADVTMTTMAGDTLYRNSFCTLFQEWLVSGDTAGPRAMEGTVLVPMPRDSAVVTVTLRDNRRTPRACASLRISPDDILIADRTGRPEYRSTTIHEGKRLQGSKIRVAILPEGYTKGEMKKFRADASTAVGAILSHEPFKSLADRFDFIAVEVPSAQSGVSTPANGDWRDTAFGSHFSTFYSDRYLTTPRVHALYDAAAPTGAQHIIVLANTDVYGGGGIFNFYTLTAAGHEQFAPVVVHEFGHSFGALADEYFYENDILDGTYPLDVEPWEPNITTRVDFPSKWAALTASGEAALIEGGGYRSKGIWRGSDDCRMRTNSAPGFCPVCRHALTDIIIWLTE